MPISLLASVIPFLSKLPFIGKAVTFVTDKKRLVLEYLLIAAVITIGGAAFGLWLKTKAVENDLLQTQVTLESAKSRLTAIEFTNEQQAGTIATLRDLRNKDAFAMQGLMSDYKRLSARDKYFRDQLKHLENTNAEVRSYLDTPIPSDLACLLNDCNKDGNQAGPGR